MATGARYKGMTALLHALVQETFMRAHSKPTPSQPHDPDLAQQARPGHGVPSQDLDPAAQMPLSVAESARELRSAFTGGGMIAGTGLGCIMGLIVAGGAGAMLGGVLGSVVGAWAAMAACLRVAQMGEAVFLNY